MDCVGNRFSTTNLKSKSGPIIETLVNRSENRLFLVAAVLQDAETFVLVNHFVSISTIGALHCDLIQMRVCTNTSAFYFPISIPKSVSIRIKRMKEKG